MRNVTNLVAIAQANDAREVVLNDAEMVAMVVDVRRQQQRVATSDDPLLAEVGRAPIDFQRELVGLYDLRRLRESFTELGEERQVSVGRCLIVDESGIGELRSAPSRCALDQSAS